MDLNFGHSSKFMFTKYALKIDCSCMQYTTQLIMMSFDDPLKRLYSSFGNNTGRTELRTDRRSDGRTRYLEQILTVVVFKKNIMIDDEVVASDVTTQYLFFISNSFNYRIVPNLRPPPNYCPPSILSVELAISFKIFHFFIENLL